MNSKRKTRRRGLHIGVLILGAYLLFLGGGTLLVNLTELSLGKGDGIVIARALFGAVLTAGGVYAVWDSIRDLWRKKEEGAPPLQFIFTGTDGVCSSNVTPERLHEQIGLIEEKASHVAIQPVPPMSVEGMGDLVNMTYALMEDGVSLAAIFRQDGGVQVRRKCAGAAEAEAVLLDLTSGRLPDFSAWEPLEAAIRQPDLQPKQRLLLVRDNGTSDHEFFTGRDLDLAITGLIDGTYQKALVQNGPASIEAVPRTDGDIYLCLRLRTPNGPRVYQRSGTPNQARFWLTQFYDGSLFQFSSEGWESTNP